MNYFRTGGASYQDLPLRHAEFLDVIRRHETGWALFYYRAHYVTRYLVPDWLRERVARMRRRRPPPVPPRSRARQG